MRKIHRFPFIGGNSRIKMNLNRDAKVVLLAQRGGEINVWIEHDPDLSLNYHWELRLFATGAGIPDDPRTEVFRDTWRHQMSCQYDPTQTKNEQDGVMQYWHLYIRVSSA